MEYHWWPLAKGGVWGGGGGGGGGWVGGGGGGVWGGTMNYKILYIMVPS